MLGSAATATVIHTPAVLCSEQMQKVMALVRRVAVTDAAVLITGESGAGKELVARSVHFHSLRSQQPLVDISCAALPEHLIESELFGYEKGAFSGALSSKPGLFEVATGGTLFLDEIGEMEIKMQSKLLRVLDGNSFYRLGSTRKTSSDVRIVAATNRDLIVAAKAGEFRDDLYHRLCQFHLHGPPLRERLADILPLAQYFLEQQPGNHRFSPGAIELLQQYRWPGNIRELRNTVIKAAVWAESAEIQAIDLQLEGQPRQEPVIWVPEERSSHSPHLETLERDTILRAMTRANGHQQRAAQMLGISRRTLSRRLKAYQRE